MNDVFTKDRTKLIRELDETEAQLMFRCLALTNKEMSYTASSTVSTGNCSKNWKHLLTNYAQKIRAMTILKTDTMKNPPYLNNLLHRFDENGLRKTQPMKTNTIKQSVYGPRVTNGSRTAKRRPEINSTKTLHTPMCSREKTMTIRNTSRSKRAR